MSVFGSTSATISPGKYATALQHPDKAFRDPRLQSSKVEMKDGIPKPRSGGYALVYRLTSRDNPEHREEVTALRCFREPLPDLAARYAKICAHLDTVAARSPFFVTTRYLDDGIKIDGHWKPVTTMAWIEGAYLDVFIDSAAREPHLAGWLESRIRGLADDLSRFEMAHGDLHHKNILISTSRSGTLGFHLIDYDGMYVPALANQGNREPGHEDYQHPDREDSFGPSLDAFSLMVLYLNVVAVQRHPAVWDARNRTEGLLTREIDYLDPDGSETLRNLAEFDDLRAGVTAFKRICLGRFSDIPPVREFFATFHGDRSAAANPEIAGPPKHSSPRPPGPLVTPAFSASPEPTRPAHSKAISPNLRDLRARDGQDVRVVGRLARQAKGNGTATSPFLTLYLEAGGGATFEIMVDEEVALRSLEYDRGWSLQPGNWVWVQGLLLSQGARYVIDLEQPANMTKVTKVDATHFAFYPELAASMKKRADAEFQRSLRARSARRAVEAAKPMVNSPSARAGPMKRPTVRSVVTKSRPAGESGGGVPRAVKGDGGLRGLLGMRKGDQ